MWIVQNTAASILYYATIIVIYSTALSLPLSPYTQPSAEVYRSLFETDVRNETQASPLNTTRAMKSKWLRFARPMKQENRDLNLQSRNKKSDWNGKPDVKRGLNIGLHIKMPSTPKYNKELDRLEEVLEEAIENNLAQTLNTSACPRCDEEDYVPERRIIKPGYNCDGWDPKYRLCVLERNIGDTVTFYLSSGKQKSRKSAVTWKKEFHKQDTKNKTTFVINPDNSPENIIIGKQGYELRISPITETDVGYNLFSATINGHPPALSKVYYMIRSVPIDLGFVYVGETIELNIRSFVSIPAESLVFRWYMEKYGEHSTLPSNMRTSATSGSIRISELRQEQEGILACSIYTNLNFLATKKRFLMKDLKRNNDVLKLPPDHDIPFEEEDTERDKRNPKTQNRHKRDINMDELVEKALEIETTTERKKAPDAKSREKPSRSYNEYDFQIDAGTGEVATKSFMNSARIPGNSYKDHVGDPYQLHSPDIPFEGYPADVEDNRIEFDSSVPNGHTHLDNDGKQLPHFNYENSNNSLRKGSDQKGVNYFDINEKGNFGSGVENSEIILNIDRIPGPRRASAEEKIAKLISSCFSDFECASAATCMRSNLKQAGFCKCLPGFYGIGIFCREDIWMVNSNFDIEELHNPDDIPKPNGLSVMENMK